MAGDADEAAAGLLDAAAVGVVRRRAGVRPGVAGERPAVAPQTGGPQLPEAARRRLAMLLADRTAGGPAGDRRGRRPNLAELLPQWLAVARREGFAAPPALLPALLDAARARTDLRADALAFAGPRGLWLAGLNPDWKFALRAGARRASPRPARSGPEQAQRLWEEGLFAERVALLGPASAGRPAGARWRCSPRRGATERAEDRLMFLDSLRAGLSAPDEPFLEQALTDRSRNVRATAAELLSALPRVRAGRRGWRRGPASCDLARDRRASRSRRRTSATRRWSGTGWPRSRRTGRGERAWWLGQLVEAAPLATWRGAVRGPCPEQEIVALPVLDDWRPDLHAAWCRAAVRQRDAGWARALLGSAAGARSHRSWRSAIRRSCCRSCRADERAEWVADFIATHGLSEAFQMLGVCAVPWGGRLGRAVVDALDIARDAGSYPWSFSGVMGLAERCLDPAVAEQVADAQRGGGGAAGQRRRERGRTGRRRSSG